MENPALLKSVGLFAEFDPEELQRLSGLMTSVTFHPGDTILDEGNANRALHVLKSGRIRVTRTVHGGEVALCDLAAGQTFGELSIIEDGVASASLRAIADAEVLSISIGDLAKFFKDKPAAAGKFWRAVSIELRRRLIQTNDVVARYFEVNQALVENPTFREAYAMCLR